MKKQLFLGLMVLGTSVPMLMAQSDAPPSGGRPGFGGPGMGQPVEGVVTAVNGAALTVKSADGTIWIVDTTTNTRVMKERQPAKITDVQAGQTIFALGMQEPDKKEVHAMVVSMMSAEQAAALEARRKEMQANLGKTYIMGRVEKIEDLRITVMRPDKVEQVVSVDENTLLRRGGGSGIAMGGGGGMGMRRNNDSGDASARPSNDGEPITLADIKVGDMVTGPGALQGSTLVLKELHVMVRRGRRGGEGSAPSENQ